MKAIMIMYDSLNRHFLPGYGGKFVELPNFRRLSEKTVQFENCYVGSMPCMPARRELHTGRYNFLHRSWGPLEPFDTSMPEILQMSGVHTHLTTDHYHYFEDGGATYHNRYSTYANSRGQESDRWGTSMAHFEPKQMFQLERLPNGFRQYRAMTAVQNMKNRERCTREEDFPQVQTFEDGLAFIRQNHEMDNWFVQIETFDPHEPFFSPENIQRAFFDPDRPLPEIDCPAYAPADNTEEEINLIRTKYAALLTMCDKYLGKVLDAMDEYELWDDTMLIVNTDHGFLLSEHGVWGKSTMPLFNEIAHTPFYVWDPRCAKAGISRESLVQTIDIAPTLLDYFGLEVPDSMQGKPLKETIMNDTPVRDAVLYGYFGDSINICDGRYVYMRTPVALDKELNEYTLMPAHMKNMFSCQELMGAELARGMSFAKGVPVLKIPARNNRQMLRAVREENALYDLRSDPGQLVPISDPETEERMCKKMVELMRWSDAPVEQYARVGLEHIEV